MIAYSNSAIFDIFTSLLLHSLTTNFIIRSLIISLFTFPPFSLSSYLTLPSTDTAGHFSRHFSLTFPVNYSLSLFVYLPPTLPLTFPVSLSAVPGFEVYFSFQPSVGTVEQRSVEITLQTPAEPRDV